MEESEKGRSSQVSSSEVEVEVYRQYRELARNEDRLFSERLLIFLTAHSILFAGYIVSFQSRNLFCIRLVISTVGIALCVVGFILGYCAMIAWNEWVEQMKKIEENLKKIKPGLQFPEEARHEAMHTKWKWPWIIGTYCLPSLFLFLWGFSLFFCWR